MLGDNIRRIREEKNIHQKELAKLANITNEYLNRIEKGKNKNPSTKVLKSIAEALNIPVENLYKEDKVEKTSIEEALKQIYDKNKDLNNSLTNQTISDLLEHGYIKSDGSMDKEVQKLILEVAKIQARLESIKKGNS
jgi:transcriptional regulator with XRE-family HTH domain